MKVTESADIYLRVVNYTLSKDPDVGFKMRVVNTTDDELVYISDVTTSLTASLLIPAYGYNIRYQYHFEPVDEAYCSFYGNVWVERGTTAFEVFKQTGFNLSDGGRYWMSKGRPTTFKIPAGATLKVEELCKFYCQNIEYPVTKTGTEGGYDVYTVFAPVNGGGTLYYVVSQDGCMKKGDLLIAGSTITVDALEATPNMHEDDFEANIISNGNASKFISLEKGATFDIWTSRAWQAIDNAISNKYLEPDKHYTVVSGDSVTVD